MGAFRFRPLIISAIVLGLALGGFALYYIHWELSNVPDPPSPITYISMSLEE
jgi:hypothetical protein